MVSRTGISSFGSCGKGAVNQGNSRSSTTARTVTKRQAPVTSTITSESIKPPRSFFGSLRNHRHLSDTEPYKSSGRAATADLHRLPSATAPRPAEQRRLSLPQVVGGVAAFRNLVLWFRNRIASDQ
jgi:hypothetical protein